MLPISLRLQCRLDISGRGSTMRAKGNSAAPDESKLGHYATPGELPAGLGLNGRLFHLTGQPLGRNYQPLSVGRVCRYAVSRRMRRGLRKRCQIAPSSIA